MLHVTQAQYVAEHRIHLWFNDGSDGEADFSNVLDGPIFAPLTNVDYFRQFQVAGQTLTWDNGADFAPEYLHQLVHSETPA